MKGTLVKNHSLLAFRVEDIRPQLTPFGVYCEGFGRLVLGDMLAINSISEMMDALPEDWVAEIMEELHALAAQAWDEQENFLRSREEAFANWRAS